MPLSSSERSRYSRHLLIPEIGPAGQEKLKAARVLVVGAGGLGTPAALYLAGCGVGTLGVLDHDRIELSNLQRQVLYPSSALGEAKARVAHRELRARNPEIQVVAHEVRLEAANVSELFATYDVVVDGTDRFATRYLINDACVLLRKPLVSAAIHRFEGQLFTYVPGRGPCYRCLFPEPLPAAAVPNCAEAGVFAVLPGVMGTLQATEAVKLVLRLGTPLCGRLLTFDAVSMRFDEYGFNARKDCAVCGEQPTITMPEDAHQEPAAAAAIRRISPRELAAVLRHSAGLAVIDVREPAEFAVSHLPGAINVPLSELRNGSASLPAAESFVFVCRSGARSLDASLRVLPTVSAQRIAHLEGGLLAWAREVDQSLEVAPA